MARTAIGKTQQQVADETGCARITIHLSEVLMEEISKKNANVIRAYYESHGILFIDDDDYHVIKVPK